MCNVEINNYSENKIIQYNITNKSGPNSNYIIVLDYCASTSSIGTNVTSVSEASTSDRDNDHNDDEDNEWCGDKEFKKNEKRQTQLLTYTQ